MLAALIGMLFVAASDPLRRTVSGWFGHDAAEPASASVPGADANRSGGSQEPSGRPVARDEALLTRHLRNHDAQAPRTAAAEDAVVPQDLEKRPEAERMALLARERFGPRIAPTAAESARYNLPRARIEKQRDGKYWVITDDGPSRPELPPGTIVERDPERR
ncbi:hypothetical protein ABU614_05225 [Lysobacter firmicutimachus]|uniref:Uncharacterized protein n=1 Tax=Lysobacter firmicutimachus TaxID=1792846 RepID=A0AAU8MVA3_9GAMM